MHQRDVTIGSTAFPSPAALWNPPLPPVGPWAFPRFFNRKSGVFDAKWLSDDSPICSECRDMRIYVQKLYLLYLYDERRYRPQLRLPSLLLTGPVLLDAALPHSFGPSDDIALVVYRTVHLTLKIDFSASFCIDSLFLTLSLSSASNSDLNGNYNHPHSRSTCWDIGSRVFRRRETIIDVMSRFKG